ncbi:cysteine hydrolase [Radiobacillus kanasensis]|uniref:cysteine hydrolase family protein n=1 Tax=Radiobacillus kanasensis TaxID=2844358 RepID=UPI001E4AE402|nr:cysteine hydrolase family protein [Radiobacillus kanasensis]UFU00918.1 cysteine hydrolase [Radiobacillus kanasensis]
MSKKALLVIDVQKAMFEEGNEVYKGDNLLKNLDYLLTKARSVEMPIFYIQHNEAAGGTLEHGTEGWEVHSEISPAEEDILIQKRTPDSFFQTSLEEELKKFGIEHLIITGIQTEVCVDTTCRRAFSLGFKVTLVSDTHSTWNSEDITAEQIIGHHNRVLRWFAGVEPVEALTFK